MWKAQPKTAMALTVGDSLGGGDCVTYESGSHLAAGVVGVEETGMVVGRLAFGRTLEPPCIELIIPCDSSANPVMCN